MLNFLKRIFKSSKKDSSSLIKRYPENSSNNAMLFIGIKSNINPEELQSLAMSMGAPLFFTKSKGINMGRCGLPNIKFPIEDIGLIIILDNIINFLGALKKNGIEFKLNSALLSEADHNTLMEYLSNN